MLRKIITFICIIGFAACPGHSGVNIFLNENNLKIYKHSYCKKNRSFPQMISIPFFESATQIIPNCDTYPKYKTSLAMMVFYHHWYKNFGDEGGLVRDMLQNVMIEWGVEKKRLKSAYNIEGKKINNVTIIGVVNTKSFIWVWQGYDHKISESSLMHELVHLAIRAKLGHGDRDHEGYKYPGWTRRHTNMINQAKNSLRAYGI